MNLLDVLNDWTEVLLGVGILDQWQVAAKSKATAQKAEKLAYDKRLREAARIVEQTLDAWSSRPGFWERLIRRFLLGNLLKQLKQQLGQWHSQISEADKLAAKAKALLKNDTGDPLESQALSKAIALYKSCAGIVHDEKVLREINHCQQELQRRQQFQKLVTEAEAQAEQRFFKLALPRLREAEKLYPTDAVKAAIATCVAQVTHEETYATALKRAQQGFKSGRLRGAIALLESALNDFPRSDGMELLDQLQNTVKGREKFRAGLNAEKLGALKGAASMYEEAKALLSDPTDCQIRLGLVAIRTEDWATALSHLEDVRGEQSAYLRGFAQAKQGNLQQAHREWQSLTQTTVGYQRDALKSLVQRQRLLALENIEQQVKDENLAEAKAASTAFIQKFGSEPLVQGNLDEHIQPRLETAVWQGADWGTIADTVERIWIEQPNLTSLHNWAVATYYRAQSDSTKLSDLIAALSTAMANLTYDPALKDLPWLGNTPVDFDSVSLNLQRQLEQAIDAFKDQDINEYLQLRDRYRLEVVALRLMGNPPTQGLSVQGVYVTPGCYDLHKEKLKDITFPAKLWGTLYTPWGIAVAACVEGDTQRAIQLNPLAEPSGKAESFARNFVAYYEGCYLLQQQKWREAMTPLNQAWVEIRASSEWQKELDILCGLQRQAISDFKDHLEFAQLWCNLLGSQLAKSYLAEYKAEQIRDNLAKEQISFSYALQELQAIKQIDEKNPVVLNLIEKVEFSKEMQEIQELMQRDRFEEAAHRAKYSKHERVRYIVSEFFLEVVIKNVSRNDLNYEEMRVMKQLGRWAYEICPDEPAFQEVYRLMKLPY